MSLRLLLLLLLVVAPSPLAMAEDDPAPLTLRSPDGQVRINVRLGQQARPAINVFFGDIRLASGTLGLEFSESGLLSEGMTITGTARHSRDATYAIPIGKASSARDHHNELVVSLQETTAPGRKLDVIIRAFDDGIAFRYRIPEQGPLSNFVITEEETRISFTDNPIAKVLPLKSHTTPYEAYYETLHVSELPRGSLFGLPMLLQHPQGAWIAVTEAGLTDYAGMYLVRDEKDSQVLRSQLSPLPTKPDGVLPLKAKVIGQAPFESPWRVVMIADDPGRLIESDIVFHLNDPPANDDTSWIKPGKTTFPWWNHYVLEDVDFEPGVNTATMKYYVDFCAEHGIPYHSLDGLDITWYGGPIHPNGPTDVTKSAPSIDMPELLWYAKEKGVRLRLWMHWLALKPQLEVAFATYEEWGIEGVMIDFMDRDDQEMVRWYHEVAETAARHHLTVTWHGAYQPPGMERTWPNVLTYEAALNQEYNKWQPLGVRGTPPQHNLDIGFVRMLAGSLDYHQGGMRSVLPEDYQFRDIAPPVQGTRGHQLAMYVVYLNHLPMMADYPTAYRGQPGLEFLIDVPTTWDETRVLYAELDKCLVVARRSNDDWYVGGMTAGEDRDLELPLDFLDEGTFEVELYLDDPAGGPTALSHRTQSVTNVNGLTVRMPRSGGFAARLRPTP